MTKYERVRKIKRHYHARYCSICRKKEKKKQKTPRIDRKKSLCMPVGDTDVSSQEIEKSNLFMHAKQGQRKGKFGSKCSGVSSHPSNSAALVSQRICAAPQMLVMCYTVVNPFANVGHGSEG